MSGKAARRQRDLARVDHRPTAGSATQAHNDPVSVGLDKSIVIDMSRLATPSNVYDADVAWIEHRPGDLRLFFGKLQRDSPGTLRSRLEVRFPPESLVGHFWRNSRDFHKRVDEFISKFGIVTEPIVAAPEAMKAEKEHSVWANFEAMAHAGTEAAIDFYALPPSGLALHTAGRGSHGLQLAPIARIQMTVFELSRLLASMEPVIHAIQQYVPGAMERRAEPVEEKNP